MSEKILFRNNQGVYSISETNINEKKFPPIMTTNTAPSPYVATASSAYTAGGIYYAFDNSVGTNLDRMWHPLSASTSHWLKIDLGQKNEQRIEGLSLMGYNSSSTWITPNSVSIQGSNDNTTFEPIYTIEPPELSWLTLKNYYFKNSKFYRYYRIVFTLPSSKYVAVSEARFLAYDKKPYLNKMDSFSNNNILSYGNDSSIERISSLFRNKNYILQENTSQNIEGLWTTKLDRKPLSIRFN
ncbi:discoidin domain-containing protein [Lysinibacillus sp. NPDC092081]|uniref:discoidin domain-containing protein n=1 Tax=Lysinibacillus sp. NPDC092081 TaxID=3364131 RepID=UPI00381005DC